MAYRVPTLDEIQSFLVAFFKALFPGRNVGSRFSFYWKMVKVISAAVTDVHAHVFVAQKDVMPDTAAGAFQDRWLAIVGTKRKGATPSRKSNAGRLIGTIGTPFNTGAPLLHRPTGQTFQINETGTIPGAGFVDVDILAISTGSATRLRAKEVLELTPGIAGIKTNVELQLDLDEDGTDQELEGSAKNRLLTALGTPSAGGNQADYVRWLLDQLGVSFGYCYPNRAGIGSVDLAALHTGTGTSRLLTVGENAVVLAAIQLLAPSQIGGSGGALRMLTVVGETANVEIKVQPSGDPSKAMDWDDTTVPTVVSWNGTTRQLQLSARPASMAAGDRLCIFGVASQEDCAPVVIESLVSTDSVILQTVPKQPGGVLDATPAATDKVYAGGPLTSPIRDAIIAHINSDVLYTDDDAPLPGSVAAAQNLSTTKLQVLLEGIGTSNPAGKYGTWQGTLTIDALSTIARYTRGVRLVTVVTPAVNQDSTDYAIPNDAQIGVLQPGYILVRKG